MSRITTSQLAELLARDTLAPGKKGRVDRAMFQAFLDDPDRFVVSFPTTVNRDIGLIALVQAGVGSKNLNNINTDITFERFPLTGTGVREVDLEVQPYLDGETSEQAAVRLVAHGFVLEGIAELAAFQEQYPEQIQNWSGWVLAINEASRWTHPDGNVLVPYAYVDGSNRNFNLKTSVTVSTRTTASSSRVPASLLILSRLHRGSFFFK